jgi:hypothetical protein
MRAHARMQVLYASDPEKADEAAQMNAGHFVLHVF